MKKNIGKSYANLQTKYSTFNMYMKKKMSFGIFDDLQKSKMIQYQIEFQT